MRFVILGPTQLHVDGQRIDLGSAKQRGMLALLLYHVRRPVSTKMIVDELWAGKPLEEVRNSLYQVVSRIRGVVKNAGVPGRVLTVADSYRLDIEPDLVDLHLFNRRTRDATRAAGDGDHATSARMLAEAIDLWQGTPLADLRGEWSSHRRGHLTDTVLLGARKRLFDSQLALGEQDAVLAQLGPLLEEHSLDETLAQQWILALDRSGRHPDASAFYLEFRRRWLQELGSEPAQEVHDAYRHTLDRRNRPNPRQHVEAAAASALTEFTPPRQLPRDIHDFTGHQAPLADLDATAGRGGAVVVIDGMPGVGKPEQGL